MYLSKRSFVTSAISSRAEYLSFSMRKRFCMTVKRFRSCSGPVGKGTVVLPFLMLKLPRASRSGTITSGSTSSRETISVMFSARNSPFSSSCSFFSRYSFDGVTLSSIGPYAAW